MEQVKMGAALGFIECTERGGGGTDEEVGGHLLFSFHRRGAGVLLEGSNALTVRLG